MHVEFYVTLMTKSLLEQKKFYSELMSLDIIFESEDAIALGKEHKIFLLLKYDANENSHHLAEHKGASILTFKVPETLEYWKNKAQTNEIKIRDNLVLPQYKTSYLFLEDHEGNELCLQIQI